MPPWSAPPRARWTVGDDLDWCQLFLHDQAALFAREELLGWYQDAYRQLLARAQSTRQWRVLEIPPRYTITYTYDWERAFTFQGTSRSIGYRGSNGSLYTYAWEVEQAEGVPVTDGAAVMCTQLWEYAYLPDGGSTDQTYTFAVPRSQERIAHVYWDHKVLIPRSTMELDGTESFWWREQGEPWIWSRGTQSVRHFDIYQFQSGYEQSYNQVTQQDTDAAEPGALVGLVRGFSGDRTYVAVSADDSGGVPYGLVRAVDSPDRQYLAQPTWETPYGVIRAWHGSSRNLLLWEIVIPDHPTLTEEDTPTMVPAQLQKYLRSYVLWRAFGHQGEGQRLDLAAWFEQRWLRGVALMTRLGWVTRRDRGYSRGGAQERSRAVPRPRLPSNFPRWIGV